jgi:predicted DNA-binding protein
VKTEKYDTLVQTRLTKEQSDCLEQLSNAEGLTVASYVRRIIIKEINLARHGVDGWPVLAENDLLNLKSPTDSKKPG